MVGGSSAQFSILVLALSCAVIVASVGGQSHADHPDHNPNQHLEAAHSSENQNNPEREPDVHHEPLHAHHSDEHLAAISTQLDAHSERNHHEINHIDEHHEPTTSMAEHSHQVQPSVSLQPESAQRSISEAQPVSSQTLQQQTSQQPAPSPATSSSPMRQTSNQQYQPTQSSTNSQQLPQQPQAPQQPPVLSGQVAVAQVYQQQQQPQYQSSAISDARIRPRPQAPMGPVSEQSTDRSQQQLRHPANSLPYEANFQLGSTPQVQQIQPTLKEQPIQSQTTQPRSLSTSNSDLGRQQPSHVYSRPEAQLSPAPIAPPAPNMQTIATKVYNQPHPNQPHHNNYPLYYGHNPYIEILKPHSYADDNIVTLNLSHSHIYEIDSDAFVGQRFEHIDLSNNKLGLIHSRSFRIGPNHSKHNPYNPYSSNAGTNKTSNTPTFPTRRPPPTHPKKLIIDFSQNPAIVALSGAFDHIDVPNCMLNFTNSTVELKFGAFKKYFKEHPGHIVDIESVDCCEQEWLLGYKHNFVARTHCDHDPSLFLANVSQQVIIDSCIAYVTRARRSMTMQGPSVIHLVAATPKGHSGSHTDQNQYLAYLILGGTAMILTSLSIYIIFYMFSLKAAFVCQMQQPPTSVGQHKS